MTTLAPLEELASYVPALILRHMASDTGATLAPTYERFPAAVLFADLSGFTALTEHLARQSLAGAEELTRILDLYFGHLVSVVTNHGGDVVKFAGDGLLALWYGDEALPALTQRAVQCGLVVQMMMVPDVWATLDGAAPPPPLKVRVGVGAGEVTTMRLGGVFGRWELLVTGAAVAQAAQAEGEARSGEVLIAPAAWALVAAACFGQPLPSGAVRLRGLSEYLPMRALALPPVVPAMAEALRAFIPKAILARVDAGQTAWLAEQRRVTVLFVQLPDLRAETPLAQAQAMLYRLQRALYRYEGSITRLGTDAKGPTLVAALGLPPLAHEDDSERGVRAALAMRAALSELGCRVLIGVSSGRALCGAVGGQARREYTMMGPMVNRSARLMQAAAAGGCPLSILCDEPTFRAARARIGFSALAPLALKGFAAPVPVFCPLPEALAAPPLAPSPELIGHEHERRLIADRLARMGQAGAGGTLIIEGEAGIGKSALLGEARARALEAGLLVLSGAGSPLDLPPYHAWCAVFAELLSFLSGEEPRLLSEAPLAEQTAAAAPEAPAPAAPIARDLARRALLVLEGLDLAEFAPLLAAVAPLGLPETARTAALAGQVRADNTRELLVRLLGHVASLTPLLIIFEDAQWLDPSSWALLHAAVARVPTLLCLVATRPLAAPPPAFQQLAYGPRSTRLQLRGLAPAELRRLLARRLAVAEIPEALWQLIAARSQGNPFVGEELLHALRERGALVVVDGVCHLITSDPSLLTAPGSLPDTVEGLITSRIDRLSAAQQLTLKVASVIGPLFALSALAALHPVERDRERLVAQLFALQQAGLVVIEAFEPDLLYAFKHAVGCEVAYNLMSFGQRRSLHQLLAERYETAGAEPTVGAVQIAHHWRQAEQPLRALPYLVRAGAEALHGGAYREAADLLGEALAITAHVPASSPSDVLTRARWERQLGEAYHGLGRLVESREQLERAVAHLGFPIERRGGRRVPWGLLGELARQLAVILLPGAGVAADAGPPCRPRDDTALDEAARAYALLAQLAYYNGQLVPALYATLRGLNLGERAGCSPALAGAYASAALAVGAVPPLARRYQRRAQAAAARLGHLPTYGWLAEAQALAAIGRADWRRAAAAAQLGVTVAKHLGDQRRRAECAAALGLIDLRQGCWRVALSGCEELRRCGLRAGDGQVRVWGLLGAAEALQGLAEDARAEALLGEAEALLTENFGGARAEEVWAYALLGRAALRRQAYEQAAALAAAAAGLLGRAPSATLYAMGGYVAIAEIYLGLWAARSPADAAGRAAYATLARQACRQLERFALAFPVARPAALICSGLAAWQEGRRRAARQAWRRAQRLAARMGLPHERAQAAERLRR